MPNLKKSKTLEEISNLLEKATAIYFVNYQGLKVSDLAELRGRLKESNALFKVTKNTLLKIALANQGMKADFLEGPTGIILGLDDPVTPLKAFNDFARDRESIYAKGGFLENRFYDLSEITRLAQLPSKKELLAGILGSLQVPLQNLIWSLQAPIANLIFTLEAISKHN